MRGALLLVVLILLGGAFLLLGGHEPDAPDTSLDRRGPDLPALGEDVDLQVPGEASVLPEEADGTPPALATGATGGAVLEGVVLDRTERPVADAALVVTRLDLRALKRGRAAEETVLAEARTDAQGRFRVDPGTRAPWYRLTATKDAHARGTAWAAGLGTWTEIRLAAPATLQVLAFGDEGRPVGDAAVEVDAGRTRLRGITSAAGRAVFTDAPPGAALVRVRTPSGAEGGAGPLLVTAEQGATALVWVRAPVLLSGRVVDADAQLPLADAEVHVARPGESVSAGKTREDGTFAAVEAGPPGSRVLVAVRAAGYAPALEPFHLPDTDHVHEIEIRLAPASPWRGRVVDADGDAVEGALVTTTSDGIAGRPVPSTRTDAEGRFELPPPPPPAPGRQVLVTAEASAGHAAYAVGRGDVAPEALVLRLARGVSLTGRVVDAQGEPVTSAAVRLDPAWRRIEDRRTPGPHTSRLLAMNEAGRGGLQTATNAQGWFRVDDVPNGFFRIRLLHGRRQAVPLEPFEIAGRDLDLGTITLDAGHVLRGRVVRVDGSPVSGAGVAFQADREQRGALVTRTTTSEDGAFRLEGLDAGRGMVRVTVPGTLGARENVEIPSPDVLTLTTDQGAVLRGAVFEGEQPYTGTFVLHLESEGRVRRRMRPSTHRTKDGGFTRGGILPGAWHVRVETPGGLTARTNIPLEIAGPGAWEVRLDLKRGSRIEGRLLTPQGQPVAGGQILVTLDPDGLRRVVTSGRSGDFRVSNLPEGIYELTAEGRGGARTTALVHLGAGERQTLDVELAPGASVAVQVVDERGRPVEGALLLARNEEGSYLPGPSARRTDRHGRVVMPDLPIEALELVAKTRTGLVGTTEVVLEADKEIEARIVLRKAQ